jgi:hypothetical protein
VRFEWDEKKAQMNLRQHGVSFDEATEVFLDANVFEFFDADHSVEELRHNVVGFSSRRLLLVVFTVRSGDVTRIISARKAGKYHQRLYERQGYRES